MNLWSLESEKEFFSFVKGSASIDQLFSFEGDVVLDPFCGSGTTCVAAYKTKRNYLGLDIEQKYVELARKRLSKEKSIRRIDEFLQF